MQTIKFVLISLLLAASVSFANEVVCKENAGKAALVIIDMQPYFVNRFDRLNNTENKVKFDQVTAEQTKAINTAIKFNIPIIFIEYYSSRVVLGETNDTLKEAVKGYNNLKVIRKTTDGMFDMRNEYRQELVSYLQDNNIGTLVITGANGGACVLKSIQGSLKGNCSVVAYGRAIADFNYPEFIFPYLGHYPDIVKAECIDCTFRETAQFFEAENAIAKGSSRSNSGSRSTGGYR